MFPPVNLADPVNRGHVLNRGLRGWWFVVPGLYGGSRFVDLLGRRHGIRNAGSSPTSWSQANRPGGYGSIHFPGLRDSYVACPSPNLPASPALAVSAWFKTSVSASAGNNHVIGWGGTTLGGNAYRITIEAGVVWLRVHSGAQGWGSGLADGKWHHVLLTTPTGGRLNSTTCYIDGKSFGVGSNTQFVRPVNSTVNIGQNESASTVASAFSGQLDDIRIANAHLRSDEARALYSLSRQYYPGLLERPRKRLVLVAGGGGGGVISLGQSVEVESLQPLIISNPRSYAAGQSVESESLQSLLISNPRSYTAGTVAEAESAHPLLVTNSRSYTLGQATEAETARPLSVSAPGSIDVGQAAEADQARPLVIGNPRTYIVGQVAEVETVHSLAVTNPRSYTLGQPSEAEAALPLDVDQAGSQTIAVGQAVEIEAVLPLVVINPRTYTLGQSAESESAISIDVSWPTGEPQYYFFRTASGPFAYQTGSL